MGRKAHSAGTARQWQRRHLAQVRIGPSSAVNDAHVTVDSPTSGSWNAL